MRDIIFTFFNYFVFFYTSMLAIFFVTFAFLSFISLKRRKDYYVESYMRKTIKESPYTPGISVIAPAFNEEKTIIDNVNSMLALDASALVPPFSLSTRMSRLYFGFED